MFPRLVVDEMIAISTTDSTEDNVIIQALGFNDRDELYFSVAGATTQFRIEVPRVSPPPPQDYYALAKGDKARDIQLWQGFLGKDQTALMATSLMEQDNAQGAAIGAAVAGAAGLIVGILIGDGGTIASGAGTLVLAGQFLEESMEGVRGQQVVGSFAVKLDYQVDGTLGATWEAVKGAKIHAATGRTARIQLKGEKGGNVILSLRVVQPRLPRIVNVHSGQCLDVVGESLTDGAIVQQYANKQETHGNSNQRWFLKGAGLFSSPAFSYLVYPGIFIFAEHSGKVLTPVGVKDGAQVVQQMGFFGATQIWQLVLLDKGDVALVNLRAQKCLEVANQRIPSHRKVQLGTWQNGTHQRWRMEL